MAEAHSGESRQSWSALSRRTALLLGAVTLLGLAVRIVWAQEQNYYPLGGDGRWYLAMGANLAEGRGYVMSWDERQLEVRGEGEPTAFWPPVYPLLIAAAFKVGGVSIAHAKTLEVVLSALAIPLVFFLGRALFDERTGLLGAGIFAVLPESVLASPIIYSEVPFTLFLLAALLVLVVGPPHRLLPAIGFGALAALAMLTRGQGVVLLPLAAAVWLARDGGRAAGRQLGVALLGAVLVLTPWTVRNAVQMHAFVPLATSGGFNLRVGHSPRSDGQYVYVEQLEPTDGGNTLFYAMQPDQEVRRANIYTKRAIDYIFSKPGRELELSRNKLAGLFGTDPEVLLSSLEVLGAVPIKPPALRDALAVLVTVTHYAVLALALFAAPFLLRARDPRAVLLAGLTLLWALMHILFFAEYRYLLPLLAVLVLPAAWLLWQAADAAGGALRGRSTRLRAGDTMAVSERALER